jgi:exopolyphosphatase/guanosine-5'-triphosphate,3'-diphosphate pyrophosphatase
MDETRPTVAAVDCGTNSTRLLVVDGDGSVLEREMRITRLGQGVDATHVLRADAVARTVSVLREFRALMDRHGVARARVVATSAARDVTNAQDFLTAAHDATGFEPEILSGLEEGALSFAGATAHLPAGALGPGPVLVVDIGGGSTELATGVLTRPTGSTRPAAAAVSLDVGCVRVTERYLPDDPPGAEALAEARRAVDAQLAGARPALAPLLRGGLLVGLAGTVSTLAALDRKLTRYDRAAIHHTVLGRQDVARWLHILAAEPSAARLARPGMVEGRADVIVAGVLILDAVMTAFDRDKCLVSEDDILDGLAASLR